MMSSRRFSGLGELIYPPEMGNDGIYTNPDNVSSTENELAPYWTVNILQECYILALVFFNRINESDPGKTVGKVDVTFLAFIS